MLNASYSRRHRPGQTPDPFKSAGLDSSKLVPFGPYGAGQMTGHPVGLVIVFGILLMGLFISPLFLLFLMASLVLGGGFGIILWLRHR
jgi:hypothetical protein